MKIAITGATGSLGGALIEALRRRDDVERLVALSRDEVKSGDLSARYADYAPLRCQLADVRDRERLTEVFRGCEIVIHAAALKRIGHSVYSPGEMVKTNVIGTMNVIHAATEAGVGRVLFIGSDKEVEPTNLYGMSKAVASCYAIQSNSYALPRGTRVSCVRYGNVLGSRGSVIGIWRDQLRRGVPLTLTDPQMTRFILTLPQAAAFVLRAIAGMEGGEVFVPRLPAVRLDVLAEAVERAEGRSGTLRLITGLRPGGEKLHEALISREEPPRTWWTDSSGERFVILPTHHSWRATWPPPTPVCRATPYTSDNPCAWLSVEELIEMLRTAP